MGIRAFFGKTINYIGNIVGISIDDNTNGVNVRCPNVSASIGSVLSSLLSKNEETVGDRVVVSSRNNTQRNPRSEQQITAQEQQTPIATQQVPAAQQQASAQVVTRPIQVAYSNNNNPNVSTNPVQVTDDGLNKLKLAIRAKCQKLNINFGELIVNLSALTGKTIIEFNKIDNNLQMVLLNYVMESMERVDKANIPDVKKLEAVVTDAALMYHFITHDKSGNVYDIENMTPEEIAKRRQLFDVKLKARREEKLAEIDKLPESERAAAKEALKEELAGYRKHVFDELSKKIPFESALELILIVSVKDLGDAAKELMESYPIEIREKIANTMHSFESFKEYINIAKGRGEDLGDEKALAAWEQYHKIFGTYKTKENLEMYEAKFQEARKNGEFSEEICRATAMGIGEAAYANINMTSEEKESFVQQWVSDNDGLLSDADMAKVESTASKYIEELLEKNPKIKDNFQKVKSSIKEIVEKTLERVFDTNKNNKKEDSAKETKVQVRKFVNAPSAKVLNINKEVLSYVQQCIAKQAEKFEKPAIKKSDEEIAIALIKGVIDEKQALKNLDNSEHKFIKMCVQNSTLTSMYDERIKLYIQTEKDEEKLRTLAAVAPHDIVIAIVHNMTGDKQKFTSELIVKHEVDYNTKVLLENYAENVAA